MDPRNATLLKIARSAKEFLPLSEEHKVNGAPQGEIFEILSTSWT